MPLADTTSSRSRSSSVSSPSSSAVVAPVASIAGSQAAHGLDHEPVAGPVGTAADRSVHAQLGSRQAGVEKGPEQLRAHARFGEHAPSRARQGHVRQPVVDPSRREGPRAGREVALQEGDDGAGPEEALYPAQNRHGILEVHEDPASDDRVEVVVEVELVDGGADERRRWSSRRRRRGAGQCEDVGVDVDADDVAVWPDEIGQQQGHVARTAAEVEHLHPRADAGGHEQLARDRAVELGLADEPAGLAFGAAQRVVVDVSLGPRDNGHEEPWPCGRDRRPGCRSRGTRP